MFTSGRSLMSIPPTCDAHTQHVRRAAFQAGHIWAQALEETPIIPDCTNWGWLQNSSGSWVPRWTTLPEASKACYELIRCKCKTSCTGRCKCSRSNLKCTELCACKAGCVNIHEDSG